MREAGRLICRVPAKTERSTSLSSVCVSYACVHLRAKQLHKRHTSRPSYTTTTAAAAATMAALLPSPIFLTQTLGTLNVASNLPN